MKAGGVATAQPLCQNSVSSTTLNSVMTCEEEALKRQRPKKDYIQTSVESTKQRVEEYKHFHDAARIQLMQLEREDMEKMRRRYLEEEIKKHAEQQAKHRDVTTSMSQMGMMHSQPLPVGQFAPAPGAYNMMPVASVNAPGRQVNIRKRPYNDGTQNWMQQPMGMCRPMNGISGNMNPVNGTVHPSFPQQMPAMPMQTKMEMRPPSSAECMLPTGRQYGAVMPSDIPSTSAGCMPTMPPCISTIEGARCNAPAMIDLGDSQMRNFMDQIRPGNTLNDLGDGCLDDILNGPGENLQQPSTSTVDDLDLKMESPASRNVASLKMESPASRTSNSIVSPVSLTAHTPLEGPPSTASNSMSRNNSMSSEKAESVASRRPSPDPGLQNTIYGNPLGAPLSSSTPSSSSPSSCCFSQTPSTSGFAPAAGVPNSVRPTCANITNLPNPACTNQVSMMSANNPRQMQQPNGQSYGMLSQSSAQQPYPYMMDGDVGALMRMQQRFMDPMSVKRQQMTPTGFSPAPSMTAQPQPSYEAQAKAMEAARMAAACNQRAMVSPQYRTPVMGAAQMQQMAASQGQMFQGQYVMHSSMQRPQTAAYPNPSMAMHPARQQQMPMYPSNGQIPMQQQPQPQPQQYPAANGYVTSSQQTYFSSANRPYQYS